MQAGQVAELLRSNKKICKLLTLELCKNVSIVQILKMLQNQYLIMLILNAKKIGFDTSENEPGHKNKL